MKLLILILLFAIPVGALIFRLLGVLLIYLYGDRIGEDDER